MKRQIVALTSAPAAATGLRAAVIVPSYRRPADLARCLDALARQTRRPDQVIVIVQADDKPNHAAAGAASTGLPVELVEVTAPGVVHALNAGLARCRCDLVATLDDDAAPRPDWLARIVAHFTADPVLGGLGGRDVVHPEKAGDRPAPKQAARITWYGRLIGNHHLGEGGARDADILKGVNSAFRLDAIGPIGFEANLPAVGAQDNYELSSSFGLQAAGWRLVYDPRVTVDHFPAPRPGGDHRAGFNRRQSQDYSFNRGWALRRFVIPLGLFPAVLWALLIGTRPAPGLARLVYNLLRGDPLALPSWRASVSGFSAGWRAASATAAPPPGPKKIAIVFPGGEQRGGAEALLLLYLRHRPERKTASHLIIFQTPGPMPETARALGYQIRILPARRLRELGQSWRAAWQLAVLFRSENIGLVLSWMSKSHLYAGPAAWAAGIPAIWYQHGVSGGNWLDRVATAIPAAAVLCCSKAARAGQLRLTRRRQTAIVHPAVDLHAIDTAPARREARRAMGIDPKRLVVLMVARQERWKGIDVFLDIGRRIVTARDDVIFVLVGGAHIYDPAYAEELAGRLRGWALGDRLRLAGQRPQGEIPLWLRAADVYFHPNTGAEPFGMAIVEAMAAGLPVIAGAQGGPAEIIAHNVDGLLVDPGETAQLGESLAALLDDPARRARLGGCARQKARRFSVAALSGNLERQIAAHLAV